MAHLRALAGSSTVKIEPIGQAGSFGTSAPRKSTSFASYLDLMKNKEESEKWYLTTQYEEEQDEEGEESGEELDEEMENGDLEDKIIQDSDEEEEALQRMLDQETSKNNSNSNSTPQIQNSDEVMEDGDGSSEEDEEEDENEEAPPLDPLLPSPTDALISEFPPQPELLGSLVLSQCNLWLGGCKDGKSSGLHHDFHDNLYVLVSQISETDGFMLNSQRLNFCLLISPLFSFSSLDTNDFSCSHLQLTSIFIPEEKPNTFIQTV